MERRCASGRRGRQGRGRLGQAFLGCPPAHAPRCRPWRLRGGPHDRGEALTFVRRYMCPKGISPPSPHLLHSCIIPPLCRREEAGSRAELAAHKHAERRLKRHSAQFATTGRGDKQSGGYRGLAAGASRALGPSRGGQLPVSDEARRPVICVPNRPASSVAGRLARG